MNAESKGTPKYKILSNYTYIRVRHLPNLVLKLIMAATFIGLVVCGISYQIRAGLSRYFQIEYVEPFFSEQTSTIIADRKNVFTCFDKPNAFTIEQKGEFWVLNNYIRANRWFACNESITLTTIGDLTFLDNLKILVERWNGPISVAVYTPGTDMEVALHTIKYLRLCYSPTITEFVSFHFYFEANHRPQHIPHPEIAAVVTDPEFCTAPPPWQLTNTSQLYRQKNGLLFPINVGRNIARDAATTHFILSSDIELYPSQNIIPNFLDMIDQNNRYLQATKPCVFVLPPFELLMLANRTAVTFHEYVCSYCHKIPNHENWLEANISEGLHVLHTEKRRGQWEPFFIGTNNDPYFEERLPWEGRCDKMPQVYTMCIMDYDLHILDNAFLVHKPGIKKYKPDPARDIIARKTSQRIHNEIMTDIQTLYGTNENCKNGFSC